MKDISYLYYWALTTAGFEEALKFAKEFNISAPDCIHLATAIEAGCDILVTMDSFFRKEAKLYLPTSSPGTAKEELRRLDFVVD